MRVLHIFHELKYSGAEIMYVNASGLFQKQNIQLVALCTAKKIGDFAPKFVEAKYEILHRPIERKGFNLFYCTKYFFRFFQEIKKENIDVIHIHRSKYSWAFSFIGFLAGKKIIRTVHNVFKHRKYTWFKGYIERLTARKIFNVIFQSIGKSVYENELNYYKNKTYIVNNWYDNKRFFPAVSKEEKIELRRKLNIPLESFVVISTGGCSHVKNHHDILNVIELLKDKINICYLHLGEGVTLEEEIEIAQEKEIISNVMFLGNQDDVRSYLIASDVYLMPSRFEGLGNATLEAMACGLPSILYNVVGLRDLITNDDTGFLIAEDYSLMADRILDYYHNPQLIKEKSKNAIQFVNNEFSIQQGVKGIMKLYNL